MSRAEATIDGLLLLTARQVAGKIAMSERWVRREGALGTRFPRPVVVGGRTKRWRACDILGWLEATDGRRRPGSSARGGL